MWVYHLSWLPGSENTSPVGQELVRRAAYPRIGESLLGQLQRVRGTRDAYSRKIVGVATRASMRTDELPVEAFEHAL